MYKVLIAEDDLLMQEALKIMITKDEIFDVIQVVNTGEEAVKVCKENAIDLVFMDIIMPGMNGLDASKIIHQANMGTTIYLLSGYAASAQIRSGVQEVVKDVLEKPISRSHILSILENFKSHHEDSFQNQLEMLAAYLKQKDFGGFYTGLPQVIDKIYYLVGQDTGNLTKIFTFLGQNLLDMRNIYDENKNISEMFPINEILILEKKTSELWLFRVMDYMFQKNSISRYSLLENIFLYIEQHIKEDITLNTIINNCAISQGYLSRIFREQFQVSVTEYLHMKKMHLAKGYFYFTEQSIAEVAFRLSYNESSYFSKVFKKYEKMTVKEYKNMVKKKIE